MNKTGQLLSKLRKEKGLTQQQVADALHITNKTVSKWECGEGLPEISMLLDIASLYGITVDELLKGELSSSYVDTSLYQQMIDDRWNQGKRITLMIMWLGLILYIGIDLTIWQLKGDILLFPCYTVLLIVEIMAFVYFSIIKEKAKRNHVEKTELLQATYQMILHVILIAVISLSFMPIFGFWHQFNVEHHLQLVEYPQVYYVNNYLKIVPLVFVVCFIIYFVGNLLIEHKKSKRIWIAPILLGLALLTCMGSYFSRIDRFQFQNEQNYLNYVEGYESLCLGVGLEACDIEAQKQLNQQEMDIQIMERNSKRYEKYMGVVAFKPQSLQVWKLKENQDQVTFIRNIGLYFMSAMSLLSWFKLKKKEKTA